MKTDPEYAESASTRSPSRVYGTNVDPPAPGPRLGLQSVRTPSSDLWLTSLSEANTQQPSSDTSAAFPRINRSKSKSIDFGGERRGEMSSGDSPSTSDWRAKSPFSLRRSGSTHSLRSTGDSNTSMRSPRTRSRRKFSSSFAREKDSKEILSMWRADRVNRHECCGAPGLVIHPKTRFRQRWDIFIILLIVYSSTFEPFKAAFAERDLLDSPVDYFVDSCYWFDIVLNFMTGYEVDGYRVILDRDTIFWKYLRGWFAVDFVATFPWDAVIPTDSASTAGDSGGVQRLALIRLLRLIRILRVVRVGRIVERLSHLVRVRSAFFKISQLALSLLIVVHIIGCFFFLVPGLAATNTNQIPGHLQDANFSTYGGSLEITNAGRMVQRLNAGDLEPCDIDVDNDIFGYSARSWICDNNVGPGQSADIGRKYVLSVYWAITTISTIGYGDVSPNLESTGEIWFTTFTEFVGMFVFSYTVSAMAGLVSNLNAKDKEFQARLDRYMEFMRDKGIPLPVQDRVVAYLNYVQATVFEITPDEEAMMQALSPSLQSEVQEAVYVPHLKKIPVFADHQEFLEALSMCVRPLTVLPGDLIVRRGEPGATEMFVVMSGCVKVFGMSMDKAHVIRAQDTYPFFGVAEMLASEAEGQLEHRSVVAIEMCCLARISRNEFNDTVTLFPRVREKVENVAQAEMLCVLDLDEIADKQDLRENVFDALVAEQMSSPLASPVTNARKGMLTATSLPMLVERLGAYLSAKQIVEAMTVLDPASTGGFTFDNFFKWWTSKTLNIWYGCPCSPITLCCVVSPSRIFLAPSNNVAAQYAGWIHQHANQLLVPYLNSPFGENVGSWPPRVRSPLNPGQRQTGSHATRGCWCR
jgi:CRP-like cAMP-binding protein